LASGRQLCYALSVLVASLAWFELTPTDLWLQEALFDTARQQWIWSGGEPVSRLVFYDGAKSLLMFFALSLAGSLVFMRYSPTVRSYGRGIRIVVLSLILVPACVAGLKATTNVACPRALTRFGGEVPYVGILSSYPAEYAPITRQQCFPASHASSGFALLALFFFFKTPRNRALAIGLGLAAGRTMGSYKILIEGHFLSHTVVSMLLAWVVINAVVIAEARLFREVAS